MSRYLRLLWVQIRASAATAMQYRVDFLVDGLMSLWWMVLTFVPLLAVFQFSDTLGGWTLPEALLVVAWFQLLHGILEGAINPSLVQIAEAIRTGTLDFVLIKPADAQFLVSTAKFAPWKIVDVLAALALVVIAFVKLGRAPSAGGIALATVLLATSIGVLYSIWILVVSASFWVVRLDNLSFLFSSIFDAARWPLTVFRGVWRFVFTFVFPLGLMTTYPAEAILGRLGPRTAVLALVGAVAFAALSRLTWTRAIGHYTSASS